MFSNVLVPLTNNACRASLTLIASDVFEYNKTTYRSSFSNILLVSMQEFVERAEKVGVTSGNTLQMSHTVFPLPEKAEVVSHPVTA